MAEQPTDGAQILGLHMEGPYLSPRRSGAMDPAAFRDPLRKRSSASRAAAPGVLRHLTLAPERASATEFIRWLTRRGVMVSGGHTGATYEETEAGIEAGIRVASHTFYAMDGLHHRELGALGAFVLDERVTCELIADGWHVDPVVIEVLLRVVGRERGCLVSDAGLHAGLPPGAYELFGRPTRITEDGCCRYPDGTLAGSAHFVLHGTRTLVERVVVPLGAAMRMASQIPARVAGLEKTKGSLAPGKHAELIVVSSDWSVLWTLIEGRVVHAPDRCHDRINPIHHG